PVAGPAQLKEAQEGDCPTCKETHERGAPEGGAHSCPTCGKSDAPVQQRTKDNDKDEEAKAEAQRKISAAQDLLASLQAEIRYMLAEEAGNTEEIARLTEEANDLRNSLADLLHVLENGSDRDEALASVGGILVIGAAIPAPEEVITWPVAGLLTLGILITMSSTSDLLEDAVDDLSDTISRVRRRRRSCRVFPLGYHRGGDAIHNTIADTVPPNVHPGSDIEVVSPIGRKSFDALDPSGALWEVKTLNYSGYAEFLKPITVTAMVAEMTSELAIATACGHPYVFAVTDAELHADLLPVTPPGVQLRLL
ncbi:MAG: DUF6310 domain-containing protein, partial [Bacteroidota bacterium]